MIKKIKNIVGGKYLSVCLNVLGWLVIFATPIIFFNFPKHNRCELLFHAVTIISFYYLNTLVLIPKLLSRGKLLYYIVSLITCLVLAGSIASVSDKLFFKKLVDVKVLYSPENEKLVESIEKWNPEIKKNHEAILREIYDARDSNRMPLKARTVISIVVAFAFGTSIKITQDWFRKDKERKEAEKARLDAEISLLKWQVNPHFLFNTLNGIYSLANRKSDKTADSVARLSNILRYMLYDTNAREVKLDDEIQYLTDYIELQKLRMHDNVRISFDISGDTSQVFIAPMLLLPFVENAFKHGTDTSSNCFIDARLKVENGIFSFIVENSVPFKHETTKDKSSGIGLKNVDRRLKLHYSDSHLLVVNRLEKSFFVNLQIKLTSNEVHHS
jgi:two-component sensor histidine kinase